MIYLYAWIKSENYFKSFKYKRKKKTDGSLEASLFVFNLRDVGTRFVNEDIVNQRLYETNLTQLHLNLTQSKVLWKTLGMSWRQSNIVVHAKGIFSSILAFKQANNWKCQGHHDWCHSCDSKNKLNTNLVKNQRWYCHWTYTLNKNEEFHAEFTFLNPNQSKLTGLAEEARN